jgi:hypothetical protein
MPSFARAAAPTAALAVLGIIALGATPAAAGVVFQNTGTVSGWDSTLTQMKGTITEVSDPVYKGHTAIRMEQTFQGFGGYHSEVRKHDAEQPGQTLYYSEALMLPSNWVFHKQNITFQQWARSDVFGSPWILMYVEGDRLKLGGSGPAHGDFGSVAGMQGKWIRIVTRIHAAAAGSFEVWVNGTKTLSLTGNFVPSGQAIRWSVGMYCTRWREEQPAGLNPMVLFHDHMRIATTYEEADPAAWDDGAAGPPAPPLDGGQEGGAGADAGAPEAGAGDPRLDARPAASADGAVPADAREGAPAAGTGGSSGPPGSGAGGAGGAGGRPPVRGTGGAPATPDEPPGPATRPAAGGCRVGGAGGADARGLVAWLLVASVALARRARRVRSCPR